MIETTNLMESLPITAFLFPCIKNSYAGDPLLKEHFPYSLLFCKRYRLKNVPGCIMSPLSTISVSALVCIRGETVLLLKRRTLQARCISPTYKECFDVSL